MTRTTEQIRQALADGRACRRVHVFEEAWYWPSQSRTLAPGVVKSWSVGVDALTESGRPDGCIGEFDDRLVPVWQRPGTLYAGLRVLGGFRCNARV